MLTEPSEKDRQSGRRLTTLACWLGATFQLGPMLGSAFVVRKSRVTASGGRNEE
jgi:hypothetical protein